MYYTDLFKKNILTKISFANDDNKVFVYTANLNSCKKYLSQFWECLSYSEKIRAQRYCFENIKIYFILSKGFLRYILSYYTQKIPKDIEFIYNKYGKPFLKEQNIYFNISHSREFVTYIITLNYNVGIDIEFQDNTIDIHSLRNMVFSIPEYKIFSSFKESNMKYKYFYNLWTQKESLVKAIGQGLSYAITNIDTTKLLSNKNIILVNQDTKLKQLWYCFSLNVLPNYSCAIAIQLKIKKLVYIYMSNLNNIFNSIKHIEIKY